MEWNGRQQLQSRNFRCAYCSHLVASNQGYYSDGRRRLYICPHCYYPTLFDEWDRQRPGVAPSGKVEHVPEALGQLYTEARDCSGASAFTASVLASRKMLMNIAVEQGADEGKGFIDYVEYLDTKGFIPPNGRRWVDHIRKKGNEATHEIKVMTQDDAEELLIFIEMLLKFIYEFPNRVPNP